MKKNILIASVIIFSIIITIWSILFLKAKNEREKNILYFPNDNIYTSQQDSQINSTDGEILSNGYCQGTGKPLLTHSPMNEQDFKMITPYGLMVGGHVTPIDHQYFEPADLHSNKDAYPVYAMADSTLVDIGTRKSQFGSDEYRLVFSVSCKLFYYYDLLTSLSPEILKIYETNGGKVNIPVQAGQEIGRIGGQTLDFAVWDMDIELDGYVIPEHYSGEVWKIHTVDPLNYYTEDLKEMILKKYIRTAEPRSGKIDHDIDGTLQGTWFAEQYPGYTAYQGQGSEPYWITHVSFSPNHIDPTGFEISLGKWIDDAQQFAAKDNTPLPKDVNKDTGLVKYSLTQVNYKTSDGNYWDRSSIVTPIKFDASTYEQGCLLVKLIEDRKLMLEKFPNQGCSDITYFTENSEIYVR